MNRILTAAVIFSLVFAAGDAGHAASLWNDESSLYTANRRFKKGDIVTIVISETTKADQTWKGERKKDLQLEATATPNGGGGPFTHLGNLIGRIFPTGVEVEYTNEYSSDNSSDRNTNVSASVAAEIVNVLPNGNLQILARKSIRVNSEEQKIELTGIVRPYDITPQNTVSSSVIADARILVNGESRFTDDHKPGILERVFSFIKDILL